MPVNIKFKGLNNAKQKRFQCDRNSNSHSCCLDTFNNRHSKLSDMLRKSNEGATKGSLGALRSAIAMYYGDHEGNYPSADIVKELTENGKYINEIPYAYCPPHHGKSNNIITKDFDKNKDKGGWAYKADDEEDGTGKVKGQIWVNCSCTDSKGNV